MSPAKPVVVSGMRPTGRLHLGHYWGVLKNYLELQDKADCFFFVADWHMLTTGYDDTSRLQADIHSMVIDWLAAGIDPEKAVIFKQSDVPEHAELALLLGMVTPLSWLENNPTWKEQLQELAKTKLSKAVESSKAGGAVATAHAEVQGAQHELRTFGFLGYPVLQAADILLYKAAQVPVGQDQVPHLELSREIARKFNSLYGEVLVEPKPLLTQTPKLPGNDGRKMSKSYDNAVDLHESAESLQKKVMGMYTDPGKLRANTPGHPDPCAENPPGCVVYALHKLYTPGWEKIGADCRAGALGCVKDKRELLLPSLERPFSEFRARRKTFEDDPERIEQILQDGARKARAAAQRTLAEVRRAMRLA